MPDVTLNTFNHESKTPGELEQRRLAIISEMTQKYKGYEDPDIPTELLQELAVVTSFLRRKNAGPPKPDRKARTISRVSVDDLMV